MFHKSVAEWGMIYGYARVSTDAQDLTSRLAQLKATGCERVLREKISRPPRSPFTVHQQRPRDGRRPDVPAGACAPQRAPWT